MWRLYCIPHFRKPILFYYIYEFAFYSIPCLSYRICKSSVTNSVSFAFSLHISSASLRLCVRFFYWISANIPCRGVSHTPWRHPRGLVDVFGRMRYAPTRQLGEMRIFNFFRKPILFHHKKRFLFPLDYTPAERETPRCDVSTTYFIFAKMNIRILPNWL